MASAQDRNGVIGVWGSGFSEGEGVSLLLETGAGRTPVGNARANSAGAFSTTITVTAAEGVYSLWAVGTQGTEASAPLLVGDPK